MIWKKQSVIMIIKNKELYLIGRKDPKLNDSLAGEWSLIGGSMKEEDNHKFLKTAKRELFEETGINNLFVRRILAETKKSKPIDDRRRVIWLLCDVDTFDTKAGDDIVELTWVLKHDALRKCNKAYFKWPKTVQDYFLKR